MTDYLSLTEFVPGTKAKAEEVNANFAALKDAVSAKAAVNGDATQTFSVAGAVSAQDAVNKSALEETKENITTVIDTLLNRFCIVSGNVTSGVADLLTYSGTTLSFKTGTSYDALVWISANGTKETITDLANITGLSTNGTYSVVKELGVAKAVATSSNVTIGTVLPTSPLDGDYHCLTSKKPKTYKRVSGAWIETQYIKLGTVTVSNSVVSAVTTTPFFQNGFETNFQTKGYRLPNYANPISKAWNTTYKSDQDGLLQIGGYNGINGHISLYINSVCMFDFAAGVANNITYNMPISAGDTYSAVGGTASQYLAFYPLKGANQCM